VSAQLDTKLPALEAQSAKIKIKLDALHALEQGRSGEHFADLLLKVALEQFE
jgi:hypothetical protein